MSARTRKDWILWGALGCALVSIAHAEYTLATAAHFNEYVALAVPGALDLYVIRALQQRRDVFVAVLAMVAANVASHLIAGGVLQVRWPVIAAVGAVAPLIVWRVYSLKYESGAVSAPALGGEVPGHDPVALEWGPRHLWGPGAPAPSAPILCFACLSETGEDCTCPGALKANEEVRTALAPDHVPGWMAEEYPPSAPGLEVLGWDDGHSSPPRAHSLEASATEELIRLRAVPDLPAEYGASAVHSETSTPVLQDSDWGYLPGAQEYVDKCTPATVKGLRRAFRESGRGIGQDRAERLLTHLGVRP